MITRSRIFTLLKLALPITLALGTSFIMVFVDLAMIGVLGNKAVAAIGLAGFSFAFVSAPIAGIAPAVQGIVARRRGESSEELKCLPLNSGLMLALLLGAPLSVLCYFLSPYYFSMISNDPQVIEEGVPYLSALLSVIVGIGMLKAFEGYWAGMAKVKVYMIIIILSNFINIFFNYTLIFGNFGAPALGTLGAGIASALSIYISVIVFFIVTFYSSRGDGFLQIKSMRNYLARVFKIGIPASLQEAFFALGLVVYFWIIGEIGTAELAATNILVRLSLFMAVFSMALGIASATLTSTALGDGDVEGAAEWGWDTIKIALVWFTILGLPMVLFPEFILSFFLHDAYALSIAIKPMQISGIFIGLGSLIYILSYILLSLGDGNRVFIISLGLNWAFFLPAVWVVGLYLNYGLTEIWYVHATHAVLGGGILISLWGGGRWKKIEV